MDNEQTIQDYEGGLRKYYGNLNKIQKRHRKVKGNETKEMFVANNARADAKVGM